MGVTAEWVLSAVRYVDMNCIYLAEDKDLCQAFKNTIMNLRVS